MKYFNTAGPCVPGKHHMLDPLARLPEAQRLAGQGNYFVVYAPRQSGKTTTLSLLAQTLNATGKYAAVRFSCETAAGVEDLCRGQEIILAAMQDAAKEHGLPTQCLPPEERAAGSRFQMLHTALVDWAENSPRPVVLLIDDVDRLAWRCLEGVLLQLRDGVTSGIPFPYSVVLCGMRDVRDLEAAHLYTPARTSTPVPYNISVASLRLADFTLDDVAELFTQHTEATGQVFEASAIRRAFEMTQGQPWLVNALARDIIEVMRVPASEPITGALVDEAAKRLIQQNPAHLDDLVAHLEDPRAQRFVGPLLTGGFPESDGLTYREDMTFTQALGLVPCTPPARISNPIYKELITRTLSRPSSRR